MSKGIRPIAVQNRLKPSGDALRQMVETSLDDDKAQDIVVIDLIGRTAVADYLIIASGTSQRHVGAMADHLQDKLKVRGCPRPEVEGDDQCDWVVLDAGDVIVHLFRPEVRSFYNLEKLWSDPAAMADGPIKGVIDGAGSPPPA